MQIGNKLRSEMSSIRIEATYVGSQPLVSVLEANLDFDAVRVVRKEYAVKSIFPLTLLITAPSVYLLNKFILDPLVGPLADKWKESIRRWLRPIDAFEMTIRLEDEALTLEAPLNEHHKITAEIWKTIQRTIDILRAEGLLHKIKTIRFAPDRSGKLIIECRDGSDQARSVDLEKACSEPIEADSLASGEGVDTVEEWGREQLRRAENYRKCIEGIEGSEET